MELCSHNHDEVAFEGNKCPVCALIDEKDETIADLKNQIERLERQVEDEQSLAAEYKEKWQASDAEVTRLCKGQLDGER